MKEQLKIAVENGGYASPRATLVEIEPITNILICSLDGDSGTEAVSDSEDSFGL